MASSPAASPADGQGCTRLFGKTRLLLLAALLALLALCIVLSFVTRGAMAYLNQRSRGTGAMAQSLVNLQPWQTAQALAPLAVTSEEDEYAREAERLADHEVDQAFAAALREARLEAQHKTLTGDALALSEKVTQLEQLRQQDQALVDGLAAKEGGNHEASAGGGQANGGNSDLDVAKAQLGLDSDELTDAQHDLARASGDHTDQIQEELASHEASMKQYESHATSGGEVAVLSASQNHTLASRISAWLKQRQRQGLIEQALSQAQNDARNLTAEHNALEAKENAAMASGSAADRRAQLAFLKDRSTERQILSIDDDRVQTEQQLASIYGKWLAQVKLQHQIVLHLILRSCGVILGILLGMLLCDALVRYWMARPALESRRMRTLRSVLEISIQALGVALILLVILGAPQGTPTILGLATAAITIALQDYIIAFLGWFVLVGRNGIHVGDWVEINGVNGEVVEIGLMTTTLLETGGLEKQGHPTGRRITLMNGFAIRGQYFNFSTAGQWMWDEISISLPADADIQTVINEVQKAALEETHENSRRAEEEWKLATRGEGLGRFSAEPVVNVQPSGSGVELHLRYVTSASGRFDLRNRLYERVVALLHAKAAASA
jgi:small-conductance mechanosensitive channel/DNA-binding protein YbaB